VYNEKPVEAVQTRFPPEPNGMTMKDMALEPQKTLLTLLPSLCRISTHRPRQSHHCQLRLRQVIRRKVQPPLRRHEPQQRGGAVLHQHRGHGALAGLHSREDHLLIGRL
jgi:hypothetical protein